MLRWSPNSLGRNGMRPMSSVRWSGGCPARRPSSRWTARSKPFLTVLEEFGAYPPSSSVSLTGISVPGHHKGVDCSRTCRCRTLRGAPVIKGTAVAVALTMRERGAEPDLLDRLAGDPDFCWIALLLTRRWPTKCLRGRWLRRWIVAAMVDDLVRANPTRRPTHRTRSCSHVSRFGIRHRFHRSGPLCERVSARPLRDPPPGSQRGDHLAVVRRGGFAYLLLRDGLIAKTCRAG